MRDLFEHVWWSGGSAIKMFDYMFIVEGISSFWWWGYIATIGGISPYFGKQ
jgi:hypothetical protein